MSLANLYKGLGMEGAVAKWYAGLTKKSLKDFEALAQRIAPTASAPQPRARSRSRTGIFRDRISQARRLPHQRASTSAKPSSTSPAPMRPRPTCAWIFAKAMFPPCASLTHASISSCAAPPSKISANRARLWRKCTGSSSPAAALSLLTCGAMRRSESVGKAVEAMNLGSVNRILTKLTFRFMLLQARLHQAGIRGTDFSQPILRRGDCGKSDRT